MHEVIPAELVKGLLKNWSRKGGPFYKVLDTGCWPWARHIKADGYGLYSWYDGGKYRSTNAHRAVWIAFRGALPAGMVLDHLCKNTVCVNPWHLEPVTQRTNLLRGVGWPAINAAKTHCSHGHPFDETNTVWRGTRRHCRACQRLR